MPSTCPLPSPGCRLLSVTRRSGRYRLLLAERLLARGGFDLSHELKTLELLKLRFGEESLRPCEVRPRAGSARAPCGRPTVRAQVMFRDLEDSKRVQAALLARGGAVAAAAGAGALPRVTLEAVSVSVISKQFWPAPASAEAVQLHDSARAHFEAVRVGHRGHMWHRGHRGHRGA